MKSEMLAEVQQHPAGEQQPTRIDKPFRFPDLPLEIRNLVYDNLFQGYCLKIDIPQRLTSTLGPRTAQSAGAALPGILLVSKAIRAEALPCFSKELAAEVYNGPCIREIPSEYLRHTKVAAYGSTAISEYIDEETMPSLKLKVYMDLIGCGGKRSCRHCKGTRNRIRR